MLLKSIDLQGYKTFAGRTTFEFAGAITCIVGPNGSGKSNIADAIRWVLGEQSYRLLRGKKTEDMIFSGSESRSRAGMASCNIIFDNSTNWLPIDFSEVAIARRAYRDGTNEYLLNGQRVRLRDITELLGASGLSERTYTIIGQGLVDAALALRAEERRSLFEEAAGISVFRSRRKEAQRRLEITSRNLERVEDILSELKPRLRSLERQARRAAQFGQVEHDLKMLLRDYYGYHWYKAQHDVNEAREVAQVQESVYEAVQTEQTELNNRLTSVRERIQRLRARLSSWHRESSNLFDQRGEITRDMAVTEERERSLKSQKLETTNEIIRTEQQITLYKQRLTETEQTINNLEEELREAQSRVQSVNQNIDSKKNAYTKLLGEVDNIRKSRSELVNHQLGLESRLSELQSSIERRKIKLEEIHRDERNTNQYLKNLDEEINSFEKELNKFRSRKKENENRLVTLQTEIKNKDVSRKKLEKTRLNSEADIARLKAHLEVLVNSDKALSGYSSGTKLIVKSAKEGRIKGKIGILSNQLDVPEELETSIASALGEYIDAILIEDSKNIEPTLDVLVSNSTQGAILPLGDLIPLDQINLPRFDGVIGIASELIKAPPNLRLAVDTLLGQTLVVKDRDTAYSVLSNQPSIARVVTLKGELFYTSGQISIGQPGSSSTLGRQRQKKSLYEKIAEIERQHSQLLDEIDSIDLSIEGWQTKKTNLVAEIRALSNQENSLVGSLNQISIKKERVSSQIQWQQEEQVRLGDEIGEAENEVLSVSNRISQLSEEILQADRRLEDQQLEMDSMNYDELKTDLAYLNTQVAVTEQALKNAQNQFAERRSSFKDITESFAQLNQKVKSLDNFSDELDFHKADTRVQEAEVIEQIETLAKLIAPVEKQLEDAEREQDELQQTEGKAREGLSIYYRQHSQAQLDFTRKQEILENLRERIENDLGLVSFEYEDNISGPTPLPLGEMVESLPRVLELPDGMEKIIRRQRAQVRRMGAINRDAQKEFEEVKERFEFMSSQVEDLKKAEKDIIEVIYELETLMEREFKNTFEKVAIEFREIFTRLFGGGSARLVITDPDDLTKTGIDIEARLPGRRTQGLSLLSGGERSLTATALVFSLLKVSPTPFCVLDEVDAMLDEANVGRFRELLSELSENTQFIVITHNRNTVQAADVIYGVTMGRDSASQVISLKLDEVTTVV
jgi:chromosome segregation protein